MSFSVSIKGHEAPVAVEIGRSILDCAIEQGGPFPYSCRAGNCGTCKCRLLSGEVEMSPFSEFALSPAEQEKGFILACRAVPWSDCEIEVAGEDDQVVHPMRDMTCRVAAITALTHNILRLELDIIAGGPFTFTPGQYARLSFADLPGRDFSMASQPGEAELVFYIRIVPGGRVGAHLARGLAVGEEVRVEGPFGSAFLREEKPTPILAIAGGSGLSPIRSIVDRALALGWPHPIHVYLGVRDERDLYDLDRFEALAARHVDFHFTPVLSEPSSAAARRTGFVTDAVRADIADLCDFTAYLAGPPPMVEAAERLLPDLGLPPARIHADAFYTPADSKKDAAE